MTTMDDVAAFDRLLEREATPWGAAKREAFARLCEAFPAEDGPPRDGLRQIERGQFDARIPDAWKPVFLDVYRQWLGFADECETSGPAPILTPRWWLQPAAIRWAPAPLRWLAVPAVLAAIVLGLAGAREGRALMARAEAVRRLERQSGLAQAAGSHLADSESEARASLAAVTDASLVSFLATEPELRSRAEAWERQAGMLSASIEHANATLRAWRFPRWPSTP